MLNTTLRWISSMIIFSMLMTMARPVQAYSPSAPTASALWTEDFSGGALPAGWSVTGSPTWTFDNPGGRVNTTGGAGNFAIADSDKAGSVAMDAVLITPVINTSTYDSATLSFKTYFKKYGGSEVASVDVTTDAGLNWSSLWSKTGADFTGTGTIALPKESAVQVRFHYYNANYDWYWQVDDVKVEVTSAAPQPPSAPSGLAVTAVAATQVSLMWVDNSSDETGFKLEWSANGTSGWTTAGTFAANATAGADGTVTCGTTRYYRVSAVNATGTSAVTASVSATTTACPPLAPAAPSGLNAAWSAPNVNLTWADNSNNETGFKVEWSANGASGWTELARPGQNVTAAVDASLTCGVTRHYRVLAYTASATSPASPSASASAAACPPPPPSAPSSLAAVLSDTTINLTWTDNSNDESGFKVERSTDAGGTWTQIGITAVSTAVYADSGLTCNTRYAYRVRAASATNGDSAYSPAAEAMSAACTPTLRLTSLSESFNTPTMPVGWTLLPASGAAAWAFNDPGARTNKTGGAGGFGIIDSDKAGQVDISAELRTPALDLSNHTVVKLIFRQYFYSYQNSTADVDYSLDGGANWVNISRKTGATVSGEVTLLVPDLAGKPNVIFRFRYYNANFAWYWQVDDVHVPSASEAAAPIAPSSAGVTLTGSDAAVSWTDNSSNETSFSVERTVNGGTTWAEVGSVSANAVSLVIKNLPCGNTVSYRVRAFAGTLSSSYAGTASVTTPTCVVAATSLNENFNTSSVTSLPAGWFTETYGQVTLSPGINYTGGSGYAPGIFSATSLRAPVLDLSALSSVKLSFKTSFLCNNNTCTGREATADLSLDGGMTWTKVWGVVSPFTGPVFLEISAQAAGKPNVLLRFTSGGNIIQVDDVVVAALPIPNTPTGLALSQTPDGVLAGWTTDNPARFRVERSPDGSSAWTQIADVTSGATQVLDGAVAANNTYFYRVSAYNSAGASAPSTPASITASDIGIRYTDVTISLYQGAPISTPAERAKYEEIIGYFADAIYEMSNGVERIGKVTIYRDKANFDTANIQWIPSCWPNAYLSGYTRSGARVELCDVFPNNGYPINFLVSTKAGGYVTAHEWGHYFFGMCDEYIGSAAASTSRCAPLSTDIAPQNSVMNNQWNAVSDLRWLNFSAAVNYSAATAQGRMYGASAWDTLARPPAQDPYVAGEWPRLYWPELAAVKPAAGQLPVIDLTQDGAQAKARGRLQVIWSPAFTTSAPANSPDGPTSMLSVANGVVREIVVDKSSWVGDTNLTEIKAALAALIDTAPDGDVFGLKSYDGTAVESFGLTAVNSQADRDALIMEINKLASSSSSANPGAALQAAYDALTDVSVPANADRVVYWITSGRATTGANPVSLVDHFIEQNIPLWIYGIAPTDGDQTNLRQLADLTGGSYNAVKDGAALQKAFSAADQETSWAQDSLLKWDGWVMDRGTSAGETVEVDPSLGQVDFELSYDGPAAALTVWVQEPDSTIHTADAADCETSGSGVDEFTTCMLSFTNPAAGEWTISSSDAAADTYFMYYVSGVALSGQSTYSVTIQFPDGQTTTYPQPIRVMAKVEQGFPIAGLNAVGFIFDPDGNGTEILFRDDGVAPDGIANDGVYSAYAGYSGDGEYIAAVQFDNAAGTAYYTDKGMMTTGAQTLPAISENFERYAEAQVTVQGWKEDDHADVPDDPANPPTTLTLDNTVVYGAIDFANDADVFKITAPLSLEGPYALRINRLGLDMDPYVLIYAEDGSWMIERYFDFTPDSGDALFVPLDLVPGQVVYVEVYHYDETAVGGVYAISAGPYQATDPTAASRKAGWYNLFVPVIRR